MSFFRSLWEGWKRIAKKIGDFQARLILAVFYFIVLAPFCMLVRSSDPLTIGSKTPKGWNTKLPPKDEINQRATRQW